MHRLASGTANATTGTHLPTPTPTPSRTLNFLVSHFKFLAPKALDPNPGTLALRTTRLKNNTGNCTKTNKPWCRTGHDYHTSLTSKTTHLVPTPSPPRPPEPTKSARSTKLRLPRNFNSTSRPAIPECLHCPWGHWNDMMHLSLLGHAA